MLLSPSSSRRTREAATSSPPTPWPRSPRAGSLRASSPRSMSTASFLSTRTELYFTTMWLEDTRRVCSEPGSWFSCDFAGAAMRQMDLAVALGRYSSPLEWYIAVYLAISGTTRFSHESCFLEIYNGFIVATRHWNWATRSLYWQEYSVRYLKGCKELLQQGRK